MQPQYPISEESLQASASIARQLGQELQAFLAPLLVWLDAYLDKRVVRTFVRTIEAIIEFRHRANGLLLSELGASLESPDHAPAGTKRLSNLLPSPSVGVGDAPQTALDGESGLCLLTHLPG